MRKIIKLSRAVLSLCLIACMMVPAVPLEAEKILRLRRCRVMR